MTDGMFSKRLLLVLVPLLIVFIFAITLSSFSIPLIERSSVLQDEEPTVTPTPTIVPFTTYTNPTSLPKSNEFYVYLIGDSMTHALGPRGGYFNEDVSNAHKGIFLQIFNYSEANQSIATLPQRLNEEVQADTDLLLPPILRGNPDPDLIIIESFGYNPLSDFGVEEGIKRQNEYLTEIMTTLTNRYPDTVIMFLATIAPDRELYGKNIDLSDRETQANERIAYIENHIQYANEHNIPLINVYEESLDQTGDGDVRYISPDDTIHPSDAGMELLSEVMTRRILEENVFPQLQ